MIEHLHDSPILRGLPLLNICMIPPSYGGCSCQAASKESPILREQQRARDYAFLGNIPSLREVDILPEGEGGGERHSHQQHRGSILWIRNPTPHPTFPLTQKLVGHSPNYALALSGKVRESQVWILHTYGLQNLRNSQMQSWAKCNARGHSHFSPGILKVQGCVVPARSNFRINLHITRQRKRNSYFPNGDVGILPPTFSGITISSLMPTSAF